MRGVYSREEEEEKEQEKEEPTKRTSHQGPLDVLSVG